MQIQLRKRQVIEVHEKKVRKIRLQYVYNKIAIKNVEFDVNKKIRPSVCTKFQT